MEEETEASQDKKQQNKTKPQGPGMIRTPPKLPFQATVIGTVRDLKKQLSNNPSLPDQAPVQLLAQNANKSLFTSSENRVSSSVGSLVGELRQMRLQSGTQKGMEW